MDWTVKFRDMPSDERVKGYLEKRIVSLVKNLKKPLNISFVFTKNSDGVSIECNLKSKDFNIYCKEKARDMFSAVDLLKENLKLQLRKKKEKIVEKKRKSGVYEEREEEVERIEIEELESKPMSREEAILQLKELNLPFFTFFDEDTGKMAVAYRKRKNVYGIIVQKTS